MIIFRDDIININEVMHIYYDKENKIISVVYKSSDIIKIHNMDYNDYNDLCELLRCRV